MHHLFNEPKKRIFSYIKDRRKYMRNEEANKITLRIKFLVIKLSSESVKLSTILNIVTRSKHTS